MRFRRSVGAAIPTRVASTTGATAGGGARATTPSRIWHVETSGGGTPISGLYIIRKYKYEFPTLVETNLTTCKPLGAAIS